MGDLESTAAILIRKLGTAMMGVFWQISGTTKTFIYANLVCHLSLNN